MYRGEEEADARDHAVAGSEEGSGDRDPSRLERHYILQRRELLTPRSHGFRIDGGVQRRLLRTRARYHLADRIHHRAVATEGHTFLHPNLVASDHPGLVFDRPRLHQDIPGFDALGGPTGGDEESLRALLGKRPELLGETSVVTGGQAGRTQRCVDNNEFIASGHQLRFTAVTENMDLAIRGDHLAGGIEQ